MLLETILLTALDYRIVTEGSVNNTLYVERQYEDMLGGAHALSGSSTEVDYETNAILSLSSGSVLGKSTQRVITSGFHEEHVGATPFSRSSGSTSYSVLTVSNIDDMDGFKNRTFTDTPIKVSMGGVVPPTSTEDKRELHWDEYALMFQGEITSRRSKADEIDLNLGLRNTSLFENFPPNVFPEGTLSEGKTIPVVFGQSWGTKLYPISEGIWQIADPDFGVMETTDDLYASSFDDLLPIFYLGYGLDFYDNLELTHSGSATLGTVRDLSDFTWVQTDTQNILSNTDIITNVSVEGEHVELVAQTNGDLFTVQQSDTSPSQTYDGNNFKWVLNSSTEAVSKTTPKIVVSTTGDVNIVAVGGTDPNFGSQWFKINADGGGTVTLTFDQEVNNLNLITHAVRNPTQTVTNWTNDFGSVTPDSISPEYNSSGVVERNTVKFTKLNSKTISFAYNSSNDAFIAAIWIDSVTFSEPSLAKVTIDFDRIIVNPELLIKQPTSQDLITNSSLPKSGTFISGNFNEITFTGETKTLSFNVDIAKGSYNFGMNAIQDNQNNYGAIKDGDLIRLAPGSNQNAKFKTTFFDDVENAKVLNLRARVVDSVDDFFELLIVWGDTVNSDNYSFVKTIGKDWIDIQLPAIKANELSIYATRGTFNYFHTESQLEQINNANIDHAIELELISVLPTQPTKPDVPFYVLEGGIKTRLPSFRVPNAKNFINVPKGVVLYDQRYFVAADKNYTQLRVDPNGYDVDLDSVQMLKDIAFYASGQDFITCDFTGKQVCKYIDKAAPSIEHIESLCSAMDYYSYRNSVGGGITVKQQYDYKSHPSDFYLDSDIEYDSVEYVGTEDRRYKYIVEYCKDHSDDTLTKSVEDSRGYYGIVDPIIIDSPFFFKSHNIQLAERIIRDSEINDLHTVTFLTAGLGIREGMAGVISHPDIPADRPSIIRKYRQSIDNPPGSSSTVLTVKTLRGKGSYYG